MTAIVSKSVSTKLLFRAWDVDGYEPLHPKPEDFTSLSPSPLNSAPHPRCDALDCPEAGI